MGLLSSTQIANSADRRKLLTFLSPNSQTAVRRSNNKRDSFQVSFLSQQQPNNNK